MELCLFVDDPDNPRARPFIAIYDYDPVIMSPNHDAAETELQFKAGDIIRVFGKKDADGFYNGEVSAMSAPPLTSCLWGIQDLGLYCRTGFDSNGLTIAKLATNRYH